MVSFCVELGHGLPKQKILNTFVYRNSSQIRKNGNGGKEASKTHLLEGRVIGWFGPVGVPFKPVIHFLIDASFTPSPLPQCYLKRLYKAFPNNKNKNRKSIDCKDRVVVFAEFSKVTDSSQVRRLNTKFLVDVAAKLEKGSFHFHLTDLPQI